jgi:hypothetical protein
MTSNKEKSQEESEHWRKMQVEFEERLRKIHEEEKERRNRLHVAWDIGTEQDESIRRYISNKEQADDYGWNEKTGKFVWDE